MRDSAASPLLPANRLHARVRTLWQLSDGLAGIGVLVAAALVIVGNEAPVWLIGLSALIIVPAAVAAPGLRYERWRYEIRARDVFLSKGVLFHTMAAIPFDRIQYVQTSQGPLDRRFSLMQLQIRTAGGHERIPGLTIEEAQRLREELARVAGSLSV